MIGINRNSGRLGCFTMPLWCLLLSSNFSQNKEIHGSQTEAFTEWSLSI